MDKEHYILGIHDGHNASVCLLRNGEMIYAIQEERLTNTKNYYGFPEKSIQATLKFGDIIPDQVNAVALASKHMSRPPVDGQVVLDYQKEASFGGKIINLLTKTPLYGIYKYRMRQKRLEQLEAVGFSRDRIHLVEHHLCHASAAYYGLPIPKDREILILTLDGSGDGLCATVNIASNYNIERIAFTSKGDSIGNIYSRITFLLGFIPWEHEYKLMGMAPYVSERGHNVGYEVFKQYIDIDPKKPLVFKRKTSAPTSLIYHRLKRDTELLRFDWICAGLQKMSEEIICKWVRNCILETGIHTVVLSGGVFMNVKVNKRIMEMDKVESIYVMPSCGDETTSFGAAYHTCCKTSDLSENGIKPKPFQNLYLGEGVNSDEIERTLTKYKNEGYHFSSRHEIDIERKVAELLADKKVVARCKGRMEFGARALGNRSILSDPSQLDLLREINLMVKKRDFWMPFAPAVLKEKANEYFVNPKNVNSPYMALSYDTTPKRADLIAAIHQADLTARPQMVDEELNPDFFKILKEFQSITGRGVLLNTSFNLHGYPIVFGPEEAMWVFINSSLDYLAVGNTLIGRH